MMPKHKLNQTKTQHNAKHSDTHSTNTNSKTTNNNIHFLLPLIAIFVAVSTSTFLLPHLKAHQALTARNEDGSSSSASSASGYKILKESVRRIVLEKGETISSEKLRDIKNGGKPVVVGIEVSQERIN